MLTPEQKAEAERKLKGMNEQLAKEEQLKATIKKTSKNIKEAVTGIKEDPKKQLELLRKLANQDLPAKISVFQRMNNALSDAQEKMKNQKEKLSRDALFLIEEKGRFEGGISEIKRTIGNIQKTVAESVVDQAKKRAQIESNLQKSLKEIRQKIQEFTGESANFDKQNEELSQKIDELKGKLGGIEDTYKSKADQKDQEVQKEKDELTGKLKELEAEVEEATKLSKECTAVEKKNFDNKISLYMKIKKFPQLSSSFESSADTLNSCKQQLLKGVQRINNADETIAKCNAEVEQVNTQYLAELKRQKEKETKIEEAKREKEAVRAHILELQSKLKEKKAAA